MAQKIHPKRFRLGLTQRFAARWFTKDLRLFHEFVLQDTQIRQLLVKNCSRITAIVLERSSQPTKQITAHINVPKLFSKDLKAIAKLIQTTLQLPRAFNINVSDSIQDFAQRFARTLQEALEQKRMNLKFILKQAAVEARANPAIQRFRIECSGRTAQSLMATRESVSFGRMPRQTLAIPIQFCAFPVRTRIGVLGVKIWVNTR